jgi:hypothetical protein
MIYRRHLFPTRTSCTIHITYNKQTENTKSLCSYRTGQTCRLNVATRLAMYAQTSVGLLCCVGSASNQTSTDLLQLTVALEPVLRRAFPLCIHRLSAGQKTLLVWEQTDTLVITAFLSQLTPLYDLPKLQYMCLLQLYYNNHTVVMGRPSGSTNGLPRTQDARGVPAYKPGYFGSVRPELEAGRGRG